ncbi:MAG: glycosyltransferase family 4 protein [Desulfobacterales bacterium]|nr:glycosyltransferase family 4 protein [Desulfobacterales bacterium]
MKVLQVNKFFYLKGGSETYLFSLIDGLKGSGLSVAEFAMADPRNRDSEWSPYFTSTIDYNTTKIIEKIKFATKILYSFEAKNNISRLLDKFKPDIVHLHIFQHQLSPSILPEIKKRNIPIIYTAHDLKSACPAYLMLSHGHICEKCKGHKYFNCLTNKCVQNSYLKSSINMVEMYFHLWMKYYDLIDLIITPSDFHRKKLIEFRFPAEKVVHVPNFVDETRFTPNYSNEGYFIFLGRLSEEKGIVTLLKAMENVTKGKLIIIGTGPLALQVQEKISSAKLKNIEVVGQQSGTALTQYIKNAMFSILPSECYENGPISLLENFACGNPVIGANIGGIPEHIDDNVDGLIFEPKDHGDLAEKINLLLSNPKRLETMGRAARQKAEKLYSKNQHIRTIIGIYDRLIQQRSA